jgi:SAM-dependent methyltransferase
VAAKVSVNSPVPQPTSRARRPGASLAAAAIKAPRRAARCRPAGDPQPHVHYRGAGIPVLEIEPARNVACVARRHNIPTVEEFFTRELADRLADEGVRADVFHAHNVLGHVPDLNGFLAGVRRLLKPDGVAVLEVPYVRDLIERCEFDTIYHEHLSYFSVHALTHALRRNGLAVVSVERLWIHGGSLRVFAAPAPRNGRPGPLVKALLAEEKAAGLTEPAYYANFARRVRALCSSLRAFLVGLKGRGHRLAAYGASAKGATLLNSCGLGRETLDFVVDRNPVKQGRYMPGSRLRIHSPGKLLEARPDDVLLLTWNFAEEILQQQAEYRRGGGRFIVPVPEPRLV